MNLSLFHLSLGHFAEGWDLYEHRWAAMIGKWHRRPYPQPLWNGEPIDGVLLVWGEQGLGDQILHAGLIEELNGYANSLVVEVEPRLVQLFARSFPRVRVVGQQPQLYDGRLDAHLPMGSLGKYFRSSWEAFPRRQRGYLVADDTIAKSLRQRLATDSRIVVGLSWRSVNPAFGRSKSARLIDFASVLRRPGCRFIDLQYGDTLEERQAVSYDIGVVVERLDDVDNTNDIDALAALITACDIVVTVSNTTAHLAGALGKPTWVMVPYGHAGIWYWFKQKSDSPWYPHVRVKYQTSNQSWADLIATTIEEISALIESK